MCLFCLLFWGTGYSDRYLLSVFITINHLWWFQADLLTTDNSVVTVQEGETWHFGLHSLFKKIGICFKVKLVKFAFFPSCFTFVGKRRASKEKTGTILSLYIV